MGASLALLVTLADVNGLELAWEAPPECGTRDEVQAAIETLLEAGTTRTDAVVATGHVTARQGEYFLTLDLREGDHHQRRELSAVSCDELRHAAALIVAMTVDPRLGSAPRSEPSPAALPEPPPEPDSEAAATRPASPPPPDAPFVPSTAPPRPVRTPPWVGLGVSGGLGLGALPGPAGVASVSVVLGGRWWRAEFETGPWFPRTTTSPTRPSIGARVWAWGFALRACADPAWQRVSFPICGGIDAGPMLGRGRGTVRSIGGTSAWAAATLDAGAVFWPIPRWGLSLRVRGHVALRRPQFAIEPSGEILHTASQVGGQVLAGVLVRLR